MNNSNGDPDWTLHSMISMQSGLPLLQLPLRDWLWNRKWWPFPCHQERRKIYGISLEEKFITFQKSAIKKSDATTKNLFSYHEDRGQKVKAYGLIRWFLHFSLLTGDWQTLFNRLMILWLKYMTFSSLPKSKSNRCFCACDLQMPLPRPSCFLF